MKESRLRALITEILSEKLKDAQAVRDEAAFLTGYNPLEKIRMAMFPWIAVPFGGRNVICQLRCPNATQIEQCGDISSIAADKDEGERLNYDEIIRIRNYQEELCKLVFNIPTFNHIMKAFGMDDFVLSEKRKELEDIKKKFEECKDMFINTQKVGILTSIETLELQLGYFLPDDTMAFITKWALGGDVSDIRKINRDAFLKAACLAHIYHKAPSDYISGIFTDHNKADIDAYALAIYNDFQKDKEIERESRHKWFFGGRKRHEGEAMLPSKN
jgi:hypothetical protein